MKLFRRGILALLSPAILLFGLFPAARAQEGLTPEEQALFDRAFAAAEQMNSYSSFLAEHEASQTQTFTLKEAGLDVQNVTSFAANTFLMSIIRGDNPNGLYLGTATVNQSGGLAFTAEGEMRIVDGVLYGKAVLTEGTSPLPYPADFTAIEFPSNSFMAPFQPQDFVDAVLGIRNEESFFNYPDLAAQSLTTISATSEEIEGQTVEVISLRFEGQDLTRILSALPSTLANPETAELFSFLAETSYQEAAVLLDSGGNLIGLRVSSALLIENVVTNEANAQTLSLQSETQQTITLSQINAQLEPITAPEQIGS